MIKYLTINELSIAIKYNKQSIYNMIHKGTFEIGKHYLKPTPKKLLFKWDAIEKWLERVPAGDENNTITQSSTSHEKMKSTTTKQNKINI